MNKKETSEIDSKYILDPQYQLLIEAGAVVIITPEGRKFYSDEDIRTNFTKAVLDIAKMAELSDTVEYSKDNIKITWDGSPDIDKLRAMSKEEMANVLYPENHENTITRALSEWFTKNGKHSLHGQTIFPILDDNDELAKAIKINEENSALTEENADLKSRLKMMANACDKFEALYEAEQKRKNRSWWQ